MIHAYFSLMCSSGRFVIAGTFHLCSNRAWLGLCCLLGPQCPWFDSLHLAYSQKRLWVRQILFLTLAVWKQHTLLQLTFYYWEQVAWPYPDVSSDKTLDSTWVIPLWQNSTLWKGSTNLWWPPSCGHQIPSLELSSQKAPANPIIRIIQSKPRWI